MATVYLGLGSNLGDREAHIRDALRELERVMVLRALSSLYETAPWGLQDQPEYLNAVCVGETCLAPHALLMEIKAIERRMGRRPTVRYGPRSIDIDILFYEDRIVQTDELQIPHPRLAERAFVLVPLMEVAPDLKHPIIGCTPSELLARLGTMSGVRKYKVQAASYSPR